MYLLGYDIGSSSVKTALVHAVTKEVIDIVQYPDIEMDMISRQKGWAEQQPELWWRYLCLGTKKIIEKNNIDAAEILSLGISYQMHGLVLVDKDQQVLRPSIIWCDSRAVSIGDQAFESLGADFCLENYQNSPGNFTASKLKWVKDNEPDVYAKIDKILLPGDYIAMKLTGKISTTISGLSEGILWNFKEKKLAKKLLGYYGISTDLIPELAPTFFVSGLVSGVAADETGLSTGIKVAYRAGDQPNNALSLNVLEPGEIAATCGTSGVVYGVVDKEVHDKESRINAFAHVNYKKTNNRIGVLLCINGAGIQYSWMRSQIALSGRSYDDMERMLASVPVGAEGVCIFPYGNGAERIFSNRNLESHIRNLEFNRHTRAHIYRAALEGVAFTFVYGIQLLQEMGIEVKKLRVGDDNMFQSKVFSTTIATLLGIDLEVIGTTGAVGAAFASGHGCGYYKSIRKVMSSLQAKKVYKPEQNYSDYKQAYSSWKDLLNELTGSETKVSHSGSKESESRKKDKIIAQQALVLEVQKKQLEQIRMTLSKVKIENNTIALSKLLKQMDSDRDSEVLDQTILMSNPIVDQIKKQHPELSYEELKLGYFLHLKFSTKQIADKLNLSYRGAETKRYRLRQKLEIPKGTSLSAFFANI